MRTVWILLTLGVVLAVLVVSCASPAGSAGLAQPSSPTRPAVEAVPAGPDAKEVAVTISSFAYNPQTIEVAPGTTITWTNLDSVAHKLTTTKPANIFDSGTLAKGDTFSHTFNEPGTIEYRCIPHPRMTGKIIVK